MNMAFAIIWSIWNITYQSSPSFVNSDFPAVFFSHQAYLQLITHEADAMPLAKWTPPRHRLSSWTVGNHGVRKPGVSPCWERFGMICRFFAPPWRLWVTLSFLNILSFTVIAIFLWMVQSAMVSRRDPVGLWLKRLEVAWVELGRLSSESQPDRSNGFSGLSLLCLRRTLALCLWAVPYVAV